GGNFGRRRFRVLLIASRANRTSIRRRGALQTDLVRDVVELGMTELLERFAFLNELLVDLDRLLGHLLVRVFRPADKREVRAGRHTLVPVAVESHAKHYGFER